ncbi:MAG: DUF1549 domain-containing protein, partial [Verrucomicrobiota bacterium]
SAHFQNTALTSHSDWRPQAWPRGPIDRFILAELEEKHLTPSRDAGKLVLLRRLTFDLIGLPPTPEDLEAFQRDESPDADFRLTDVYGEVVKQILA